MLYNVFSGPLSFPAYVPEIKFNNVHMFRLQAFYTKFYIPEKELYPAEVDITDKLTRSLVVCLLPYQSWGHSSVT